MLELRPKHPFSWDFRILDAGEEIAYLDRHGIRERATFVLDGDSYVVRRTSVLGGTFVLEREGRPIAEAVKPRAFWRLFEIRAGPELWVLRARFVFRREFRLFRGGLELGAIRPVSPFRRTAIVDLPDAVPQPLQVFLAFLVLVLWQRAAAAASGG